MSGIRETPAPAWQPIETAPKDATVLVAVGPTKENATFFGKKGLETFPAYIDPDGNICDSSTWRKDAGLNGTMWRSFYWMPLPEPPVTE